MPTVRIRFHGGSRELAGCAESTLTLGATSDRAALEAAIHEAHPRLATHWRRMRIAIDDEFADDDFVLGEGQSVDVLPPVAGGSSAVPLCIVTSEPLSIDALYDAVTHPGAGGVAIFVGVVRDHADGLPVARLDYEHHATLAEREMHRVLAQVADEIPGSRLAAAHRVGQLGVGDRAVIVAASAPHRAEAFDACRRAIDRIKDTVPIWKHEWQPDGTATWVNLESED